MTRALRSLRHWAPLGTQLALLLAGLGVFAFAPRAGETMLLIPLTGEARAQLAARAIDHGAMLLGRGPLDGSLLIRGGEAGLGSAMLRLAVLPIAAPASFCGNKNEIGVGQ